MRKSGGRAFRVERTASARALNEKHMRLVQGPARRPASLVESEQGGGSQEITPDQEGLPSLLLLTVLPIQV